MDNNSDNDDCISVCADRDELFDSLPDEEESVKTLSEPIKKRKISPETEENVSTTRGSKRVIYTSALGKRKPSSLTPIAEQGKTPDPDDPDPSNRTPSCRYGRRVYPFTSGKWSSAHLRPSESFHFPPKPTPPALMDMPISAPPSISSRNSNNSSPYPSLLGDAPNYNYPRSTNRHYPQQQSPWANPLFGPPIPALLQNVRWKWVPPASQPEQFPEFVPPLGSPVTWNSGRASVPPLINPDPVVPAPDNPDKLDHVHAQGQDVISPAPEDNSTANVLLPPPPATPPTPPPPLIGELPRIHARDRLGDYAFDEESAPVDVENELPTEDTYTAADTTGWEQMADIQDDLALSNSSGEGLRLPTLSDGELYPPGALVSPPMMLPPFVPTPNLDPNSFAHFPRQLGEPYLRSHPSHCAKFFGALHSSMPLQPHDQTQIPLNTDRYGDFQLLPNGCHHENHRFPVGCSHVNHSPIDFNVRNDHQVFPSQIPIFSNEPDSLRLANYRSMPMHANESNNFLRFENVHQIPLETNVLNNYVNNRPHVNINEAESNIRLVSGNRMSIYPSNIRPIHQSEPEQTSRFLNPRAVISPIRINLPHNSQRSTTFDNSSIGMNRSQGDAGFVNQHDNYQRVPFQPLPVTENEQCGVKSNTDFPLRTLRIIMNIAESTLIEENEKQRLITCNRTGGAGAGGENVRPVGDHRDRLSTSHCNNIRDGFTPSSEQCASISQPVEKHLQSESNLSHACSSKSSSSQATEAILLKESRQSEPDMSSTFREADCSDASSSIKPPQTVKNSSSYSSYERRPGKEFSWRLLPDSGSNGLEGRGRLPEEFSLPSNIFSTPSNLALSEVDTSNGGEDIPIFPRLRVASVEELNSEVGKKIIQQVECTQLLEHCQESQESLAQQSAVVNEEETNSSPSRVPSKLRGASTNSQKTCTGPYEQVHSKESFASFTSQNPTTQLPNFENHVSSSPSVQVTFPANDVTGTQPKTQQNITRVQPYLTESCTLLVDVEGSPIVSHRQCQILKPFVSPILLLRDTTTGQVHKKIFLSQNVKSAADNCEWCQSKGVQPGYLNVTDTHVEVTDDKSNPLIAFDYFYMFAVQANNEVLSAQNEESRSRSPLMLSYYSNPFGLQDSHKHIYKMDPEREVRIYNLPTKFTLEQVLALCTPLEQPMGLLVNGVRSASVLFSSSCICDQFVYMYNGLNYKGNTLLVERPLVIID